MANLERRADKKEQTNPVDIDVAYIRKLILTTKPEPLIDNLRQTYPNAPIVFDAIDEFEVFYNSETRIHSTTPAILYPLRLAQITPSEENVVTPTVTVIRLLQGISQEPKFTLANYGEDVVIGATALHQKPGETYREHLQRVRDTDREYPHLQLVTTKAKAIIHNSLDPAGLPIEEPRIGDIRIALGSRLERYSNNITHLFGEDKTWLPKVRAGIQMGKNALLTPNLSIPQ